MPVQRIVTRPEVIQAISVGGQSVSAAWTGKRGRQAPAPKEMSHGWIGQGSRHLFGAAPGGERGVGVQQRVPFGACPSSPRQGFIRCAPLLRH